MIKIVLNEAVWEWRQGNSIHWSLNVQKDKESINMAWWNFLLYKFKSGIYINMKDTEAQNYEL